MRQLCLYCYKKTVPLKRKHDGGRHFILVILDMVKSQTETLIWQTDIQR